MAVVETEWGRLNVPCVLRVFWVLRVLEQGGALLVGGGPPLSFPLAAKHLLTSGSETVTAVLGMTSLISLICHYIAAFFQFVCVLSYTFPITSLLVCNHICSLPSRIYKCLRLLMPSCNIQGSLIKNINVFKDKILMFMNDVSMFFLIKIAEIIGAYEMHS